MFTRKYSRSQIEQAVDDFNRQGRPDIYRYEIHQYELWWSFALDNISQRAMVITPFPEKKLDKAMEAALQYIPNDPYGEAQQVIVHKYTRIW